MREWQEMPQAEHALLAPTWATGLVQSEYGEALSAGRGLCTAGADIVLAVAKTPSAVHPAGLVNAVLLRGAVTAFDAVLLALAGGATEASVLPMRSLMESRWGILLALSIDKEVAGRHLYTRSLREQLHWALRTIPGTSESNAFPEAFTALHREGVDRADLIAKARTYARDYGSRLGDPALSPINELFHAYALRQHHEPPWYYLLTDRPKDRIDSILQLARRVRALEEYFTVYRYASVTSHGGDAGSSITRATDGRAAIQYIRSPENWRLFFKFTCSLFADTVTRVCSAFLGSTHAQAFAKRYGEEWLPVINRAKDIRIHYGPKPLGRPTDPK